jgi:DNA-binding response OmpR family regulator
MSSSASDASEARGERLGGARADFVASLGRKIGDARELLAILEDDLSSKTTRDELRRRLHALGSGARLLRFDSMARSLQEALAALDRGAQSGGLREQELSFVAQVLDDLPALAWGEAPAREAARTAQEAAETASHLPIAILVVGGEELANALADEGAIRARAFECERTENVETALELARAYAPDILVIDADRNRAADLVESLLDDPLTEPVPVLVVGTFRVPDDSARYAALGVAKLLAKPVAADALRHACDEIVDAREGRTLRITLGEPSLEQLADRLADELKRALVESVDRTARSCRVPLGEGTEVMGALWGAIARVQEIVTQKTAGAVRFGGDAPEGAIALAPWLHQDLPGADRLAGRGRGAAADVRLRGRRVVVADDDPGVTWFISDLLRTAGCEVHEALEGDTALDLAFRVQPELVVSDILMPGMDGFALCRAIRRDVALRDTPVILLSWKEDLLQRVRELGASAAAYMRKESDSRAILARVREVLRPRARIEMRLRSDGEVRGRLDDLSPRLLLELVCVIRKDARVSVRDATYLYEIDIRGGAPRRATRTASDGSYQSGERALASLIAVGAGRFVVSPSTETIRGDLSGTLFDLLARPIAIARGALAATTGARTVNVERITLDADALEEYLRATPEPARSLIGRLAKGASPRQMLLAGEVAPSLLEDVLSDLSARDAIRAVEGADGVDLLGPAVGVALAVLRGASRPRQSTPPNARASVPSPPSPLAPKPAPRPAVASQMGPPEPVYESLQMSDPPPEKVADVEAEGVPSSLEDAVMREISDRSPAPRPTQKKSGADPRPIIEPSKLRQRNRSSNPPGEGEDEWDDDVIELPSFPPDEIVPGASSSDEMTAASPASVIPVTPPLPMPVDTALPVPADATPAERDEGPYESPFAPSVERPPIAAEPVPPARPEVRRAHDVRKAVPAPVTPAVAPRASTPPPKSRAQSRWGFFLAMLAFGLLFGAAMHVIMGGEPKPGMAGTGTAGVLGTASSVATAPAASAAITATSTSTATATSTTTATATATATATENTNTTANRTPTPTAALPPPATPTPTAAPAAIAPQSPALAQAFSPETDDIPPGAEVPAGYGLIQVVSPAGARVRIDGAIVGRGPLTSSVAAPGYHEVRVEAGGKEAKNVIEVHAGKTAHVGFPPPP